MSTSSRTDDFDFNQDFVRESDNMPGKVLYLNRKARLAIVRFDHVDWEAPYMMNGWPVWIYHQEHRLRYAKEVAK